MRASLKTAVLFFFFFRTKQLLLMCGGTWYSSFTLFSELCNPCFGPSYSSLPSADLPLSSLFFFFFSFCLSFVCGQQAASITEAFGVARRAGTPAGSTRVVKTKETDHLPDLPILFPFLLLLRSSILRKVAIKWSKSLQYIHVHLAYDSQFQSHTHTHTHTYTHPSPLLVSSFV